MPIGKAAAAAWGLLAAATLAAVAAWMLSAPSPGVAAMPEGKGDLANGETLFHAGSCGTCHRPADSAPRNDPSLPSGGAPFKTPVGTFYPGNLTPDPETGIGRWSAADFVNAMTEGVSREGTHYFPAFPYTSYRYMRREDLLDLRAYLMSLPAVRSSARRAEVPLPLLARRGVGLWKRIALREEVSRTEPDRGPAWNRGAYLVNGPGHCGECHTPRNLLMVMQGNRPFAGAKHPAGEGQVPSLRGLLARGRYKDVADLALALQNGETFGYDHLSSGGMASIQTNLGLLPESDARAMAEYLASLK
jgi:mono/diheme cytochrome c family protein